MIGHDLKSVDWLKSSWPNMEDLKLKRPKNFLSVENLHLKCRRIMIWKYDYIYHRFGTGFECFVMVDSNLIHSFS